MKEYFSHDHNARHDRKIVALISKHKAAGYGIFWATNEMMHEEGGELEFDEITFGAIAKQLNEDLGFIEAVITDCINIFKLYILSDEKLTSNRVKRNITGSEERKLAKSEKAAISGRLGGIKSGESRRSKQTLQANEATLEATKLRKVKESKEKESKGEKEKEIIESKNVQENYLKNSNLFSKPNIPNFEDVHRVFLQNGGNEEMAHNFFDKNESTGWFYKGSPITNFSSLIPTYIQTWKKNEQNGLNKSKSGTSANGSSISGTSIIDPGKKYSGRLD